MRKLEVRLDWGDEQVVVGTLAEQDRRVYFEYDSALLATPLPISPFKLPVKPGLFEHTEREFAHVFGVFNDSLPDGWGLLLMDREFKKRGFNPATRSIIDRLAYIGTRGMGALTYHPPTAADEEEELWMDLDALARQAERILEGSAENVLPALRIAGGSPAGARPKLLVGVRGDGHLISGTADLPEGYRHYLIKFPSKEDAPDIGAVEAAYALMAAQAGIEVPPTRLFETGDGGRYFGAERFDRAGNRRLHMHSLSGLLHASHRLPSLEYDGLLKATMLLTKDQRQTEEAFRRMVFNVLAHNRDDHVKNFSYLMDRSGAWALAPAYDLVFSDGPGGQHSMAVSGEAVRPTTQDMLRVAEECDVDLRRARAIMQQVSGAVENWPQFARETDVGRTTERRIGKVIAVRTIRL
ncbi:MAG: type II toxin-antitoxin system HipA family toxin [Gemmatimonadetes bacterium]|nr:type II toxin-antitoxin system HipA family toxin [Gemmatimonadota bacterium]